MSPLSYPGDPYADLPFATNQPLERYRLHHGQHLADFLTVLGISEEMYLRLVAGDRDIPPAIIRAIADRLGVPPWLINECAPPVSDEMLSRARAAGAEADQRGWYVHDKETLECIGLSHGELEASSPPRVQVPEGHQRLADALLKLVRVHSDGRDPDYPAIRAYLESRIRGVVTVAPGASFDGEAWADAILEGAITRIRQRV
jgi:transcriptional regulator with XRE-family HTH domain